MDDFSHEKCTASLEDHGDNNISIQNNAYHCDKFDNQPSSGSLNVENVALQEQGTTTSEPGVNYQPVQLDNEVQSNTAVSKIYFL